MPSPLADRETTPTPATRLAPSLTGSLHLGHARTFLLTWALARNEGWAIRLRLEDLDRTRRREDLGEETLAVLAWLGIDWDGPPRVQSRETARFREAMATLAAAGRAFSSPLSRSAIRAAAAAPHAGEGGELRFDPSLRPPPGDAWRFADPRVSYRFRTDAGAVEFVDRLAGPQRFDPAAECGDFAIWTREGLPAYQLAVVVDDALDGVTEVVRGDDLLPSTARQILLQRALGIASPQWWHLPLVGDASGTRLAKRDGSLAIAALRDRGVAAAAIRGLVAFWCRWLPEPMPIGLDRLAAMATPSSLRELAIRERDPTARPRLDDASLRFLGSPP
jgi:glutamyl-tRNA synthetase